MDRILLSNLDKVHTTKMGVERIKRNLGIDCDDVVKYCIGEIKKDTCKISRSGKNWYAQVDGQMFTVNAYSYTIITAHKCK